MRKPHRLARAVTALLAAAALTLVAAPASAAPRPTTALTTGCVATVLRVDPPNREVEWKIDCTDRRFVFIDITIFSGGVVSGNPTESQWVAAGGTWQALRVYPQTTPPIDHLCVHVVTFIDPTNPAEQPQVIGHVCL
ncbi:hypothetical protein [Actinosynnema sp. NPDC020468]|uniref:hypothetical protein n=1 Tax=Actinosynnema sp. NPDC020468 TaxID=3154488 RepID=UPI0034034608